MLLPWQVASAWAFAFNTAANFGMGVVPARFCQRLGLEDNKTVSEAFPTLVTPAGWAFAIWCVRPRACARSVRRQAMLKQRGAAAFSVARA